MPSSCNAEVRIGGRGSLISAAAFRRALNLHPAIGRLAARYDAFIMAQVQQNAVCHATHKVGERISRCLLELHDRSGNDIITLKHETLAQMLALRRTTVTMVAGTLEKDGVIVCGRGHMQIVSPDDLRQRSCECYGRVTGYAEKLRAAHQRENVAGLEVSETSKTDGNTATIP
jgi:CRP-like cAMP-binding protein